MRRCSATVETVSTQPGLDLQHATGVGRSDDVRVGGRDIAHLVVEQAHRHFALGEAVDAGAPAAAVGRLEFDELQPSLYFSVVTATTLGYGDVTLSERWQLLGTFEAMGGLILFGASTAFLMELMRHLFSSTDPS